ncbi:unnamed protein product [Cuscuta epithymum]|uniref:Uncharacterized protein n=1 Tax=Cuscuta epithymum TaxID=186058 RepID=A0AAV0C969_9ASTE|nr:unnamed protein product [Cuscuta epithymum]CAH9069261.1 unnamed protein product [Cuscuta epithymum]
MWSRVEDAALLTCCRRWRRSAPPIRLLWSHGAWMSLVMWGKRIDAWFLAAKCHGGSISMVPVVRHALEPPPWDVQGVRVRESFSCSFYLFVICFLVSFCVVGFDSCLSFFAAVYAIGYGWIYENRFGCVKPTTWLAIRVALSGVTVSKSHHKVIVVVVGVSVGVSFIFSLFNVMILNLLI